MDNIFFPKKKNTKNGYGLLIEGYFWKDEKGGEFAKGKFSAWIVICSQLCEMLILRCVSLLLFDGYSISVFIIQIYFFKIEDTISTDLFFQCNKYVPARKSDVIR